MIYLNLYTILETICKFYNVSIEEVQSKSRLLTIVKARHIYFYIANLSTEKSLEEIGKIINRDHSTVIHGKNKIQDKKQNSTKTNKEVQEIIELLNLKDNLVVKEVNLLNQVKTFEKYKFKNELLES